MEDINLQVGDIVYLKTDTRKLVVCETEESQPKHVEKGYVLVMWMNLNDDMKTAMIPIKVLRVDPPEGVYDD